MVPPTGASIAAVAATWGDGIRSLDADIRLVEVQCVAPLLPSSGKPQAFQVELVKEGKPIVHIFEGQIFRADPRALIEHPTHLVAGPFPLSKGRNGTLQLGPGLRVIEDVDGLR